METGNNVKEQATDSISIPRFIGVKIIRGFPQSKKGFIESKGGVFPENEEDQPGYQVIYPDGYISWSPKKAFEDAYREISEGCMSYGMAIEAMKKGLCIARKGWHGKGMLVFKQIPAVIEGDIIPGMQSIPLEVKSIVMDRANPVLSYSNQMAILHSDGRIDGWVASSSDTFADDWYIV